AVDLLWIADERGVLLADPQGQQQYGRALATFSPVQEALASGMSSATIAEVNGVLFQLIAVPVFGPDVIGFLLLGQSIDDAFAEQLEHDTGSHISFLTSTQVFASSLPPAERAKLLSVLLSTDVLSQQANRDPILLSFSEERFLSLIMTI